MLQNRRIVVGVCGGIASYKAIDLVSKLQQAGALVDVILTEHAEEFIQPLTFSTMSHRPVYNDLWEPSGQAAEHHIALAEAADLLMIVPATAQTLAKLAHGMVDNMLTAVALATRAPILLAPAMYKEMYTHPATQANLALLRERGVTVVEPEVGRLASGAIGPGRLPDTPTLLGAIATVLGRRGDLAGRRVIVTAGGTHEPIDPVRYIGNRSSGKMGYSLAEEARDRGAHVILVTGPVALPDPYGVEVQPVETALQMRDAVHRFIADADVLIMSAAVADFRPATQATQKIKKRSSGAQGRGQSEEGEFSIELVQNPDILGELAQILNAPPAQKTTCQRLVRVGFAAETEHLVAHAQTKLQQKQLDFLVANDVSRSDSGFGTETNKVLLLYADGRIEDLPLMSKASVAAEIWDRVVPLLSVQEQGDGSE
ncbi:bifunctional phosphopantothenoylcysteine decarboxylase/phosphopantothenate--cysteine ligase CoaBC [Tengunoibacter tsumagoiensis]|uniref:Coenzyme A biosynthesis bifunctional protein CoaBC n=1 Tax=Tengunoibacter tsumagoiensis TaxID=2014871 RepID=A0A401ZU82_9CHLR|nr:bifunctional phosphopantothenoylcysteine decarboxylase/phosphopantothenate--cysteine ligase CoaBC [Tengunoibacter tsumagoiensis]GCE10413.1 phosphopantothenoylcysteine decarboxylase [Tengunoibacter tsumagoiensis]